MKTFGYVSFLTLALGTLVQAAPAPQKTAPKNSNPLVDAYVTSVFPNYIVPIKQSSPDTAFGSQYSGEVYYHSDAAKNETILLVGFDIPDNQATNCQLRFTLPPTGGFPWVQTGNEVIWYYALKRTIRLTDTWNDRPERVSDDRLGSIILRSLQYPDASESLITGAIPCEKKGRYDIELSFRHAGGAGYLNWFEMSMPRTGITVDMYYYPDKRKQ